MRLFSLAVVLLAGLPTVAQKPVHTESGDLIGTDDNGIRAYLGVPYAASPVGPLRWKAPQPVVKSATALRADKPGPACMQKLSHSHLPWTEPFMVGNETGEDCLSLDLWTATTGGHRPVLVYLHGGAFLEGSGSVATYNGAMLARRGLVVVTVNYRLGIFGYFASSALETESGHNAAGNYGTADAIAALGWVKRNIAAFGGDPDRVTLAGQSAGAEAVAEILASPRARGLFHRAILNSDPMLWPAAPVASLADAAAKGDALAKGDAFTEKYGGTLEALRAVPADTLLNAPDAVTKRPVVDGYWLTVQPGEDLQHPVGSDVPVMLGWVRDEGFPVTKLSESFRKEAESKYGDNAARFLKLYPAGTDAEAAESRQTAARDRNFAIATLYAQAYQRRRQSSVWLYLFARVPPWRAHPEFGAHHTAEIPYFFMNLDRVPDRDYTDADYTVSKEAAAQWISFATDGKPSAAWTPAQHGGGPFYVIDETSRTHSELDDLRATFWRTVLLPH